MKKIIYILLIVFSFASSSCEKDDICDANTPTTPRLVIDFYSYKDPGELKTVNNLKVIGEGMKDGIIFNSGATGEAQYLVNGSTISIPLKTNADTTTFSFILNSGNSNPILIDTDKITFNYTKKEVYVSRACGFKTLFTLDPTTPIVQTAVPETKQKWIQFISIEKNDIDNENETHIKIYF